MNVQKLKAWLIFPLLLIGGIAVGILIPFHPIRDAVASIFDLRAEPELEAHTDEAEGLHVEISETAQENLGLIVRRAALGSYLSTYDIPATIKSMPGGAAIRLSSRFEGLIRRVFVNEGMSVAAGDALFEIELTGEKLSRLQSDLLLAVRRNENLTEEINRLAPLVQQGGLANKRSLELRYEQKQLLAEMETRRQELLLMGFSEEQVQSVLRDKQLIRKVTVRVPDELLPPQINLDPETLRQSSRTFVLENLAAQVGSMVVVGGDLCNLAFHEILVVEGHAFEKDLRILRELWKTGLGVTVSLGATTDPTEIKDCPLAFVGNHARDESNTYPFYVYLLNEMESQPTSGGPQYLTWKWKPGQLGHIELPRKKYDNLIILPSAAVAEDGISRFVFEWKGRVEHDHDHGDEHDHAMSGDESGHDHEHADEFVPIEVDVVFLNNEVAILDPAGKLKVGTRIAFNNASQLLFAMQSGSGGHAHAHGHEH